MARSLHSLAGFCRGEYGKIFSEGTVLPLLTLQHSNKITLFMGKIIKNQENSHTSNITNT